MGVNIVYSNYHTRSRLEYEVVGIKSHRFSSLCKLVIQWVSYRLARYSIVLVSFILAVNITQLLGLIRVIIPISLLIVVSPRQERPYRSRALHLRR